MANINIKSFNQILGDMVRKIIADTPVNDINQGSVLLTLLEAAAANDFDNNTAILNVLELLNIDAIRNNDLDAYASNFGLIRNVAIKASGFIKVTDTTITKRSTSLYPIKPAPIKGISTLFVNNASTWNQTGTLFIGRGTTNFEGPIAYTSIVNNGTFYTINLASALQKDHLLSESVIDAQGTSDRRINAGISVKIPANNISPEVEYIVLRDAVLAAGEDTIDNIAVVSVNAGTVSNAGINAITSFATLPFSGAKVTNSNAFINGKDTESDLIFRDRIKAYSSSLARGTKGAILTALIGVSDATDGKQIASAVVTEPAKIGDPSIVYIDDGTGLEPSFSGQSVDLLVNQASGKEEFLQLANFPLPRPQVINNADAPFLLTNGMQLRVLVDGIEELITFSTSDFKSISSATLSEVAIAINNASISFKCRFTTNSTRLLLYPTSSIAETIQVIAVTNTLLDANALFKFPITEFSYIKLYQNSTLLKEIQKSASLTTTTFSAWSLTTTGNLIISVDGTPDQDRNFSLTDFGISSWSALTLSLFITAFNAKFAGMTAISTTAGNMIITSNKTGLTSTLRVTGGTYLQQLFGNVSTTSTGQDSNFSLNRQNGNLQIKTTIAAGDVISAGSSDTKGNLISTAAFSGNFNVSTDGNSRPAEVVIVVDATRVQPRTINLAIGSSITISNQGSNIMRIMANSSTAFKNVQPADFIYITNRGDINGLGTGLWVDVASCGLYKVSGKGAHITDGVDSYIEVINNAMIVGGPYSVLDSLDFQAFYSDKYPQIWRGSMTATPAVASIQSVVDSLALNIRGITPSIFRTNYVKLTSVTEANGSIAIPVSVGNATQLFATGSVQKTGTQSHIASRVEIKDVFSIFRRTTPVNANIWLDRYTYTDVKGSLTSAATPSLDGTGTYSETLTNTSGAFTTSADYDNSLMITSGSNKKHDRAIKTIIDVNNIGTRNDTPTTTMDYNVGDQYEVVKNLEFSADDNLVAIVDNDAVAKTIDIAFSRTGQVNSGSQGGTSLPTNTAFSANDFDNETGIDFGTLSVWGTLSSQSNSNFNDYAVWFKARNWYAANGSSIILRSKEYGPIGNKINFRTEYPSIANATNLLSHSNTADSTLVTYTFGSGASATTSISAGNQLIVTSLGSNSFRITFPVGVTTANMNIGDVLKIGVSSGVSTANTGTFRINAKNDTNRTVDIYNPSGVATIVGNAQIETIITVADIANSLNGKYFVVTAPNGNTIKFWYENGAGIEPAIGLTTRSYKIDTIVSGDTDITVATKTAAIILTDAAIATATNGAGTLSTITYSFVSTGPAAVGFDGTPATTFTFAILTPGIATTYESINIPSEVIVFPILNNTAVEIAASINADTVLEAVVQTAGTVIKATREETTAINILAYGHSALATSVGLYDSASWILLFQNANPNFQLKTSLTLNGVSAQYNMATVSNVDGSIGEKFKLIPITTSNIKHHLTHKALSQLNIVAAVDNSNANKKIQLKSQLLGSSGAIEVVGGRANDASFKIIGDSQISVSNSINYLKVTVPASPNTLSPGQHILLQNDYGVERLSRLVSTDTMDVVKINDSTYEYRNNNKNTYFSKYVKFTIADANGIAPATYPTAGLVWRWTHNDAGSSTIFTDLTVGVAGAQPRSFDLAGTLGASTNIFLTINDAGSASTKLNFEFTVSGQPVQGDFITFQNAAAVTWAAWFSIDGNNTAPVMTATNQIRINILSADTPNQIVSKFISALLTASIATSFATSLSAGASLSEVVVGNLVSAVGTFPGWSNTNKIQDTGDNQVSGHPIVNVNSASKYFDVVNPIGVAMSATEIGAASTVLISSSPIIEWKLNHSSRVEITSVTILTGTATATTNGAHRLNVGDTFTVISSPSTVAPSTPGTNVGTVVAVLGVNQFTYATAQADATITPVGFLMKVGESQSKYKIEALEYNNLYRLSRTSGDSPKFISCGVAVDDIINISGTSFNSINNGEFRILAIDEDSIIYENANAIEELDTIKNFNDFNTNVTWTSNSSIVSGTAGSFANLVLGDWVKKITDDDTYYNQVIGFSTGVAATAVSITLGGSYKGVTATTKGHGLNQSTDIGTGVILNSISDIRVYEGDAVRVSDSLFISQTVSNNWFTTTNRGTFPIIALGTNATDGRIFLRITNLTGAANSAVQMGTLNSKLSITENVNSKFSTIKQIYHVAIDEFDSTRRTVYLTPGNRSYKWSQSNSSSISAIGKLGFSKNVVTGIDGYSYYTGILRTAQRIIDGFEPDPINYSGRKAVGSYIEILPPLKKRIQVSVVVTTTKGVNLSEISNEITSTIINYISDLGVGQDVIMSNITVRIMNINGVAAVTFITPVPTSERVSMASNEKAIIENSDISIS